MILNINVSNFKFNTITLIYVILVYLSHEQLSKIYHTIFCICFVKYLQVEVD